jgi:biotin carboxylase
MSLPMYLLFIESNTTGSGIQALQKAHELGLEPVLFTRNAALYRGLDSADCLIVSCETNDLVMLRAAIKSLLIHRPGQVRGVTTTSEFYLEASAALAAELGLLANPLEMVHICRNKARTRQVLTNAGLPQPRYSVLEQADAIEAAVANIGLPCIIKPCDDTGSYGVRLCFSAEEACAHAAMLLNQHKNVREQMNAAAVLCEEYINGPEFSIETFAWQGEIICIGITQKHITGFPYFVECGHIYPAALSDAAKHIVEHTTRKALASIGNNTGPIHTEFKLTSQGCVIIEINTRLAGGMIPELVWQAQGIDLLKSQLLAACGEPPQLSPNCSASAGIQFLTAPRAGRLIEITDLDSVRQRPDVIQVVITATSGKKIKLPQSAYDRLGYVIVRTDTYSATRACLEQLQDTLRVVVEPDLTESACDG